MKALSFDQATITGWCIGDSKTSLKEWKAGRFSAPRRPLDEERWIIVEDSALALIDQFEPDLVVYERLYDPSFDNTKRAKAGEDVKMEYSRSTMQFLHGVTVAIQMAAGRRSIPTEGYGTRSWRSVLQLPPPPVFQVNDQGHPIEPMKQREYRRRWTKRATLRKVQMLGGHVETEDEADAFGMCLYALHGTPADKRAQLDLGEMSLSALRA